MTEITTMHISSQTTQTDWHYNTTDISTETIQTDWPALVIAETGVHARGSVGLLGSSDFRCRNVVIHHSLERPG